eukprot:TRINITY_DN5345_c0_g1_i2.p1 TRINITY_DN5345_c0_g1~~TRINITY_DN5345_c0_g1_i2.p1  ORF type:complete len:327 (+),score=19.39 TRINITY_DN5345_c0_g1_i2:115-1095(+)
MDGFKASRLAPLAGTLSWRSVRVKYKGDEVWSKQTPRCWAFVSRVLYKKWRIVYSSKGNMMSVVVIETDDESEVDSFLEKIHSNVKLYHGAAVSVISSMGRHWAIYDAETEMEYDGRLERGVMWEYQGNRDGTKGLYQQASSIIAGSVNAVFRGTSGTIVKTSLHEFLERTKDLDLRIEDMDYSFSPQKVVRNARSKEGQENYHILYNNCETFVRWATTGKSVSQQSSNHTSFGLDLAEMIFLAAATYDFVCVLAKFYGVGMKVQLALHTVRVSIHTAGYIGLFFWCFFEESCSRMYVRIGTNSGGNTTSINTNLLDVTKCTIFSG